MPRWNSRKVLNQQLRRRGGRTTVPMGFRQRRRGARTTVPMGFRQPKVETSEITNIDQDELFVLQKLEEINVVLEMAEPLGQIKVQGIRS